MLPFDLPLIAQVGLHFLELRHDVPVVSLVDQSRQKGCAHLQQFVDKWSRFLNQRRVEAFQHIRIGLQCQRQEALKFPVMFLGFIAFQVIRNAIQGPVQFGGR